MDKVDICLHRNAYLLESVKDIPPEANQGYLDIGCNKCDGYNVKCDRYFPDWRDLK